MGQKHEKFREFRTPFPPREIRKNPRSMYARVPQAMAQFVLKIELLSHIIGTTPILEMARAYGLRPRLWLLTAPRAGMDRRYINIYFFIYLLLPCPSIPSEFPPVLSRTTRIFSRIEQCIRRRTKREIYIMEQQGHNN